MKLSNLMIAAIVVIGFSGGVLGAQIAGVWRTESSKIPATYTEGDFAGQYDPADIRGSYSFGDVADAFDVPVAALAEAYGLTSVDDPAAILVKTLEERYEAAHEELEIGTDSVRLFVARYRGLPVSVADSTGIPDTAIPILQERGAVDEELRARIVSLPALGSVESAEDRSTTEAGDRTVRGMSTFGELLDWGIAEEDMEELFGGTIGAKNVSLRDLAAERGVEFSTIKGQLQELADHTE